MSHRKANVRMFGHIVGNIEEQENNLSLLRPMVATWRWRAHLADDATIGCPLSSDGLHPFFENLLPEGWLLDVSLKKIKSLQGSQGERCFLKSQRNDFFGTTATVFAGVNDLETAKEISDWMGQSTVVSGSRQRGGNWNKSAASDTANMNVISSWGSSWSSSENEIARPLLRPEEVLQMPSHSAIALIPNVRPILLEELPYYKQATSTCLLFRSLSAFAHWVAACVTVWLIVIVVAAIIDGRLMPALADFRQEIIDSMVE